MSYRTPLEARLARKATRASVDFNLIEDGDRILVGVSGGKDSWALLQILHVLRRHAEIDFSLVAATVDSGYEDFRHDLVADACRARGWDCRIEHTSIGEVMDDVLEPLATPCALCARLRRGVLYRLAAEEGATKIALGHHADDVIETLLLNMFFEGALKAMPARLVSDNGKHVVIRPLVYASERETQAYARECNLPIIGACCSACGDLSLQRQRVKRLLADLDREYPGVKSSMLRAATNVVPSHLLDPGLGARVGTPARGPRGARPGRDRKRSGPEPSADRAGGAPEDARAREATEGTGAAGGSGGETLARS
jgi:tRNA 2-thiocytidine biosynthesis protein TtcA